MRSWRRTTDEDTSIRFYNRTGRLRATTDDLLIESFAAKFTPDGKQLLVGEADGTVSFLDSATGRVTGQIKAKTDPIFVLRASPDRKSILTFHLDSSSPPKPFMQLWDVATGTARPIPIDAMQLGGDWTHDRGLIVTTTDGQGKLTAWRVP